MHIFIRGVFHIMKWEYSYSCFCLTILLCIIVLMLLKVVFVHMRMKLRNGLVFSSRQKVHKVEGNFVG